MRKVKINRYLAFDVKCVVFLLMLNVMCGQSHAQESGDTKEKSAEDIKIQKSLTNAMRANILLDKEAKELKVKLDAATARNNIYIERLNKLNNATSALGKEIEKVKGASVVEKEKLKKELEDLIAKNQKLEETIAALIKEREDNLYFEMWSEAEKDLEYAENKIQDVVSEKESLRIRNGKLHYNLGNFLFKKGEYERAVKEYEAALYFLPDDPDVYYNLAVLYDHYLGDRHKADLYYKEYIARNPQAPDAISVKERIVANDFEKKVYMKHDESQEQ